MAKEKKVEEVKLLEVKVEPKKENTNVICDAGTVTAER